MLRFAQTPRRRQRPAGPDRRGHGGLDSPAKVEMACRAAGVRLQVVGAESCEKTGLSARVARDGSVPEDLAAAIKRHRVALVERLLAAMPVGDGEGVPEHAHGLTLGEVWPESALRAQAVAGHRGARVYPYIDARVWTTAGVGLLVDAKGGWARVLLDEDVSHDERETSQTGKKPRPYTPTIEVPVAGVWPPTAAPDARGRGNGSGEAVSELAARRRWRDPDDGEGA